MKGKGSLEKADKGGDRGGRYGMGNETHSRGELSEGDVKKGYKGMGKPSLKEDLKKRK